MRAALLLLLSLSSSAKHQYQPIKPDFQREHPNIRKSHKMGEVKKMEIVSNAQVTFVFHFGSVKE